MNDKTVTTERLRDLIAYFELRDPSTSHELASDAEDALRELLASRTSPEPGKWQVEALEHIDTLHRLLLIIKEHWIDYDHVFSIAVHEAEMFMGAQAPLRAASIPTQPEGKFVAKPNPFEHLEDALYAEGDALSPASNGGEAVATDRAMRGGEPCGWPGCGCDFDAKCSDAPPTVPGEVTDETVVRIAKLYGNYIPGHGWTGFGPTPEQIAAALKVGE